MILLGNLICRISATRFPETKREAPGHHRAPPTFDEKRPRWKNKLKQALGARQRRGRSESSNCGTVRLLYLEFRTLVPFTATPPNFFPTTRLNTCIWVGISVRYQGTHYTAPRTHMMPEPRNTTMASFPRKINGGWGYLGKNRRRSRGWPAH